MVIIFIIVLTISIYILVVKPLESTIGSINDTIEWCEEWEEEKKKYEDSKYK